MILRPLVVTSHEEFAEELSRIEVDRFCIEIFCEKRDSFLLKIMQLSTPAANILKQTALTVGADVAVHREVITGKIDLSDAIYMGTRRQLRRIALALSGQPFGLARLDEEITRLLANMDTTHGSITLPAGELSFVRPLVMGVLNVTPDSFSDGGAYLDPESSCRRIDEMALHGADIIDIGAESTRPGSDPVSADEQLLRLRPVFEYLKGKKDCIWSLDTTCPEVAEAGLSQGASILNDVSGGSDPSLWNLANRYGASYILMHIQGKPKTMQQEPGYEDFSAELFSFFLKKIEEIEDAGLERKRIFIDPGIGFGKRVIDNTAAIRRLGELKAFGCPILVGASRKSFLGKLLGLEVRDRMEPSLAAAVMSYMNGADVLRVHDVAETRKALDAASAISTRGKDD